MAARWSDAEHGTADRIVRDHPAASIAEQGRLLHEALGAGDGPERGLEVCKGKIIVARARVRDHRQASTG